MRRTAWNMMIAALAVTAAVATASAQGLKAEIPFAFQAAGARMQPGTYWVTFNTRSGGTSIQMSNVDTHKSILAMTRVSSAPSSYDESKPVLTFACVDTQCVLSSLRDDRSTVYGMNTGKNPERARIATVVLKSDRAE